MDKLKLIEELNNASPIKRLEGLKQIKKITPKRAKSEGYTNNHVHSTYSFSPYSPTRIIYEAYLSGLATVGIMDHDSIAGAKEFIEAGEIMGIATTVGFEIRADWKGTPFENIRINNPNQKGCSYICIHGVPHQNIDKAENFLSNIRKARNERNRKMVDRINELLEDITIDFENDVVSLSNSNYGGSITERHVLYALANKLLDKFDKSETLIDYMKSNLGIKLGKSQINYLKDEDYKYYDYDVLNILKGSFVSKMYIDAETPEITPVNELIEFCHEIGAIIGYAYLGDVGASPTGDKKEQKFEDAFLDNLFEYCASIGFEAIAYMPSRNTVPQLKRVMDLCEKHDFFQISGEDINQPRQKFICKQLKDKEYIHLIDSTWALVGHEYLASENLDKGMFKGENKNKSLSEKLPSFAKYGQKFEK